MISLWSPICSWQCDPVSDDINRWDFLLYRSRVSASRHARHKIWCLLSWHHASIDNNSQGANGVDPPCWKSYWKRYIQIGTGSDCVWLATWRGIELRQDSPPVCRIKAERRAWSWQGCVTRTQQNKRVFRGTFGPIGLTRFAWSPLACNQGAKCYLPFSPILFDFEKDFPQTSFCK